MFTSRQRRTILGWSGLLLMVALVLPILAHAEVPYRYTNTNFFVSTHEQPANFTQDGYGGFTGYTVTGRSFRQYPIVTASSVRLHRFEIDDAFFYISDRGVIVADNDLIALSIYQTRT